MTTKKNALLLVDISNIYYCLKKQFNGAKLRYEKLLDFLESKNYNITRKIGYGSDEEVHYKFQGFLYKKLGFEIRRKRPTIKGADWDVGIAVDSVIIGPKYDAVIFATGDGDMVPALVALKQMGKTVIVIGAKISLDLKRIAHETYEITSDLFEKDDDFYSGPLGIPHESEESNDRSTTGPESGSSITEGPEHSVDSGEPVSGELGTT